MAFPKKIVKDGDEYTVYNQDQLEFHQNQGWELAEGEVDDEEIDEDADPALVEAMQMVGKRFDAVEARATTMEAEVQSLRLLVEAQGEALAALSVPPTPADAPPAPPVTDGK